MGFAAEIAPPAYIFYAISAFTATLAAVARPLPLPVSDGSSERRLNEGLRVGATVGLVILAFGTGCDNARTFAGRFESNVPEGVFELKNTTLAQELLAKRPADDDANYIISWFCFVAHEILGGTFVLPGVYLWIVASSLPRAENACCEPCAKLCCCAEWLDGKLKFGSRQSTVTRVYAVIGLLLCTLGIVVGLIGFMRYTATERLEVKWNPTTEVWKWGAGEDAHNPQGLFGVFLASGVWIAVGVLCWQWLGATVGWFLIVQLVSFVGQGVSSAAGEAFEIPSNFFEQVVTWALLGLGWELQGMIKKHKPTLENTLEEGILSEEGILRVKS